MNKMESENKNIIAHLVAASENNVIGKDSNLPWSLPDDFKYFKNKTWGTVVIMGRKTFQSLEKPLPGRTNIVITRQEGWKSEGVIVSNSLQDAIEKAFQTDNKEIFIIGGGELFHQSLSIVNRIYLTRVHAIVEGNIYYPEIDPAKWKLVSELSHEKDEKHQYAFTFQVWESILPV